MASDMNSSSPYVVNTTRQTFERDVLERSLQVPVVVDFWAAWCAPCRMLGPILEKLADEYAGKFLLVKADTEEVPEMAAAFGVQSIPAVFAIVRGAPAASFLGLLPEPQIRAWLDQILTQDLLKQAEGLEQEEPHKAEALYRSTLEQVPDSAPALIGLARTLLAQERVEEAERLLTQLESRGFLEPEAEKLKAALTMRSKQGVDIAAVRAVAEAAPENLERQLELIEALSGAGQFQEALDLCLNLVERDREGAGEKARQMMIDIFRVLPDDSELTRTYRRKLSMLLY
jgi:putative thioredoxin